MPELRGDLLPLATRTDKLPSRPPHAATATSGKEGSGSVLLAGLAVRAAQQTPPHSSSSTGGHREEVHRDLDRLTELVLLVFDHPCEALQRVRVQAKLGQRLMTGSREAKLAARHPHPRSPLDLWGAVLVVSQPGHRR